MVFILCASLVLNAILIVYIIGKRQQEKELLDNIGYGVEEAMDQAEEEIRDIIRDQVNAEEFQNPN